MSSVIIMHQTVTSHDAIGNDIQKMYDVLSRNNECWVFAEKRFNKSVIYIAAKRLRELIEDPNTVLIYHHSIYWELGEDILRDARCKVVIRYHNITPPHFFEKYSPKIYDYCRKGREQTERLQKMCPNALWLSDSLFNQSELNDVEESKKSICAPFHVISDWLQDTLPDSDVLERIVQDSRINLLFVGRIAPNKGHFFMFEVLRCYIDNFDSNIVLRIIGKRDDDVPEYNREIEERIHDYGLERNVQFIGEITDETLLAYYMASDVFLCVSEHEGFCVPILEAQGCRLPIIARNLAAVPNTAGNMQIILGEDPREYAMAVHELMLHDDFSDKVKSSGLENFFQYDVSALEKVFADFMQEKVGVSI